MNKKITIKQLIEQNKELLLSYQTNMQLYQFAIDNNLNSRSGFARFKKELLNIGIDYNQRRKEKAEDYRNSLIEKSKREISIVCDGHAKKMKYGLTTENGDLLEYGNIFDEISSQPEAELYAAKKAVFVAKKIKEHLNEEAITLNLITDAEWLRWQSKPKQKGYVLTDLCNKYKIVLNIKHVYSIENPADHWTKIHGYQKLDIKKAIENTKLIVNKNEILDNENLAKQDESKNLEQQELLDQKSEKEQQKQDDSKDQKLDQQQLDQQNKLKMLKQKQLADENRTKNKSQNQMKQLEIE